MNNSIPKVQVSQQAVDSANRELIDYMHHTLESARNEVALLRTKLAKSYWIIIGLSIIMFLVGIFLLSIPAFAAITGDIGQLQAIVAAGFGMVDLTGLFLFKPIQRLHKLMGDMGQITIVLNSFQTQTALRLLQLDINDRDSIGRAAQYVEETTNATLRLIQTYFEEKEFTDFSTAKSGLPPATAPKPVPVKKM